MARPGYLRQRRRDPRSLRPKYARGIRIDGSAIGRASQVTINTRIGCWLGRCSVDVQKRLLSGRTRRMPREHVTNVCRGSTRLGEQASRKSIMKHTIDDKRDPQNNQQRNPSKHGTTPDLIVAGGGAGTTQNHQADQSASPMLGTQEQHSQDPAMQPIDRDNQFVASHPGPSVNAVDAAWSTITSEARSTWKTVTDEDIKRAGGLADRLYGIISERVGESKDVVRNKLEHNTR